jgi:acetyl-CoA carboxylase carboxyltransferase component
MSWQDEVDGIARRRELARTMGGEQAVARQHERGRLSIRERIDRVADAGSFYEQAPMAGHGQLGEDGELEAFTPANYVLGLARVEGRPCVLGGEDFTLRGGSPSPAGLRKSVYAETLALRHDVPLVRFLEGGGGSITGSTGKGGSSAGGTPRPVGDPVYHPPRFRSLMEVMARVPVASAALGAVAGFPAARLAASHFSVMTRHTSQVLIGGPALVARAMGEDLSKDELGGVAIHTRSGVVDNVAEDEDGAFAQIRRFLGYLPTNVDGLPPVTACDDPVDRCEDRLLEIIPRDRRKVYDARKLLKAVVDAGSFFEMTPNYGRSQVTGLARLAGRPVGVWANDPRFYAGAMTADGAQKVRRFVDLCDTFHLPIVALVDEPGFMIGSQSEKAATIRYGTAAIFAVQQASVPIVSVIVRKAYGVAAAAHFGPEGTVFIWPSAESGALPIEGGVAVAFRREIEAADDPVAKRAELEEAFASRRTPFPRAEGFSVHDLIDPRETRPVLCQWLDWHAPLLEKLRGPRRYSIRP